VKILIQLWASGGEDRTGGEVTPDYVSAIDRDLPVKPDYHRVPGAGHFAFLAPCAPELAKSLPRICTDRLGFDRAAFHAEFNAAVLAFFRKHLARTDQPRTVAADLRGVEARMSLLVRAPEGANHSRGGFYPESCRLVR